MTDILTNEKQAAPSQPAQADLAKEMEQSMERQSDERIKVVRVFDDHYRCNWWAPEGTGTYDNPLMEGLLVTTNRICRSEFLRVTRTGEALEIEVVG